LPPSRVVSFVCLVIATLAGTGGAGAQTSGGNRPPVAAPVKIIGVNPLPVVRSQSETVEDLLTAMIPSLMLGERNVKGVAFVSVKDDRIALRKDFGAADSDTPFAAGTLSDLVLTVGAMQQIEQGKIHLDEDLSGLLGPSARGMTADQLLSYQVSADQALLAQLVAKAGGELLATYFPRRIFAPLKMTRSAVVAMNEFRTSVPDMAELMIALLNGGAVGEGRILQPGTVAVMERTHAALNPALPGWAYGFLEMRRNGWRALQHDGEARELQMRLVLVPETRFGYFLLVRGKAGAEFWRMLDDTLFDRGFAARGGPEPGVSSASAPTPEEARRAAGVYQPSRDPAGQVAALKIAGQPLSVFAAEDGTLVLSGAARGVLTPKDGGYWSGEGGNLNAVLSNGRLLLSTGLYQRLPLWQRPEVYFWLGLALLLAGAGASSFRRRGKQASGPDDILLSLGSAAGGFLLLALLMWLFAPAL
jgi:CubicO group peptidase (beta-lactamase class C family)